MLDSTKFTAITLPEMRANLAAGHYDDVWTSEGTRFRKRAAINKAEKVFHVIGGYMEPSEMPATRDEVEYFFDTYIKGQPQKPNSGLRTAKQAENWVREYCSICDVTTGRRAHATALRSQRDDWQVLIEALQGSEPGTELADVYELIAVKSLARECRERGISINVLTIKVFHDIVAGISAATQNTLLKGIDFIFTERVRACLPPELLPPLCPWELKLAPTAYKRSTPDMAPEFQMLLNRYLTVKGEGEAVASFGSEERKMSVGVIGSDRIRNITSSLRWFWHGLVTIGLADAQTFDEALLKRPAVLHDAIDACEKGRLGPVISSQTRRDQVQAVLGFLEWFTPGFKSTLPPEFFKVRALARQAETESKRFKRTACLNFIQDPDAQRAFFQMPAHFYAQAQPMIANFKALGHPESGQVSRLQNRALELSVLAAITAINTRFPARLVTLQRLKVGRAVPDIQFPKTKDHQDAVILDIPGRIVKNGRSAAGVALHSSRTVDPRRILRWFIDDVQPLVVRYKHKHDHLRAPHLLFGGLTINTLRRYWRTHVFECDHQLTAHMTRHYLASLLLSRGASLADVAALLCITPAVAAESYAFISASNVIQGVMNAQSQLFQELEV